MGTHSLKMPDVGEGVVEAEIVAWHVKVGDMIEEDDDLVDVMTDKATVEIPSPVTGIVKSLMGDVGQMIAVGSEILVIDTGGEGGASVEAKPAPVAPTAPETNKTPEAKVPEPKAVPAQAPTPAKPAIVAAAPSGKRPLASPAVRQRALELDVDLANVAGSGPAGRITRQDLDDFVASGGRAIARTGSGGGSSGSRPSPRTGVTETPVIGLRRRIAENMEKVWRDVPHITYVEEIDVTEVDALRQTLNAARSGDQPKLTLLPFLAKALIKALPDVPQANAHYDSANGQLTEYDGVHLGVATATDKGLIVPVIRHAEALDLWDFATELRRLSEAARTGKAKREELSGSTITITSLGAIGGVVTTPILNAPETSIIGVNKMMERPVFDAAGRVVPRKFMNLSSSFDHRIVDGYDAAQLIQGIRRFLETPATLFM